MNYPFKWWISPVCGSIKFVSDLLIDPVCVFLMSLCSTLNQPVCMNGSLQPHVHRLYLWVSSSAVQHRHVRICCNKNKQLKETASVSSHICRGTAAVTAASPVGGALSPRRRGSPIGRFRSGGGDPAAPDWRRGRKRTQDRITRWRSVDVSEEAAGVVVLCANSHFEKKPPVEPPHARRVMRLWNSHRLISPLLWTVTCGKHRSQVAGRKTLADGGEVRAC